VLCFFRKIAIEQGFSSFVREVSFFIGAIGLEFDSFLSTPEEESGGGDGVGEAGLGFTFCSGTGIEEESSSRDSSRDITSSFGVRDFFGC